MTRLRSGMNCMDNGFKWLGSLYVILLCVSCSVPAGGYRLVWSDEFNKEGYPDTSRWSYDLGDGCPMVCNWGNREEQYYTNGLKNARVESGNLVITALQDPIYKYRYTSARLVTKNKGDWKYGRIEIRARLPHGRGIWPAIWMLPTESAYGGWPKSGEIDIMEYVGFMPDSIFGSVHTNRFNHSIGTQKTKGRYLKDSHTKFHNYAVEWSDQNIDFTVDGKTYLSFQNRGNGNEEWPFDRKFHLIMNIAVGGNWGGQKGIDDNIFPQKMEVDYVRVFQKSKQTKP